MYKVVKSIPSRTVSATTTSALFDKITQPGSPQEDVKGGFLTEDDAQNFIDGVYRNNPMTEWRYSIKEE